MKKQGRASALYLTAGAVIIFTVAFCVLSAFSGTSINVNFAYYYVYRYVSDNALSAASLSDAVSSYGGAGYVLSYGGGYYVIISCYYTAVDAQKISDKLNGEGEECGVLAVTVTQKALSRKSKNQAALYGGNLTTLHQLSTVCYELANAIDEGAETQTAARETLTCVQQTLSGLLSQNENNTFTSGLARLSGCCADLLYGGFIYSGEVRALQIAITDLVVNIDLA